ncbi:hypothetical protein ASPVEDRAFT_251293 [Aspergillus versicolor CBS 583.65]|uniref:Uncharacterized protein n=1 Tax=Aspergillus versicolor CBS 583.65 TaxID=1036611 RepID=A0A1L9P5E9_ASPVE|nr:uncharacterized protein ASPVEDRAFT_251293 [Aspergillus versicolor CBS 583.65]OJI96722.1 hypothetical protein ASPVEDRAFT_251293 [Aspergillus versicolor CBS 583.65]
MAKRRPPVSLEHMEKALGYEIPVLKDTKHKRFYSDLTTVSLDVYERTKREFDEYLRIKQSGHVKSNSERQTPQAEIRHTTTSGRSAIVLGHTDCTELHSFTADIHCGFNFNLPLQLTRDEGIGAMSLVKMPRGNKHVPLSRFFSLPREIRDEIYSGYTVYGFKST